MTIEICKKLHVLIVEARFYDGISDALLTGAISTLQKLKQPTIL